MVPIVVSILLLVFIFGGWSWRKKRTSGPQPPTFPRELPVIGHALNLIGDAVHIWNYAKESYSFCLQHGGAAVLRTTIDDFYFVTDPEDCATVASKCFNKPFFYQYCKTIFGEALFSSNEKIWREDRKLLQPAYRQENLNNFNVIFNSNARELTEELTDEVGRRSLDVWQRMLYSIVNGVCGATLGLDSDSDTTKKYADTIEKIISLNVGRFRRPWLLLPFVHNISENKKIQDQCFKNVMSITSNAIQDRQRELKETIHTEAKTLLDVMIKQGSFTDTQLREHSDFMIVAGYDTVYHTLILILLLVGSHQRVQEKLYKELQDVFDTSETYVGKNELPRLVYLEAVIKESMRVYPTVPMVAREIDKDVKLKDYVLPKGSNFVMCIYGMHHHPMWGADVEEFRPERWLEPGGVPENHNAYSPFSMGKRNCIGKQYALNVMKIYLAHILRKYRVSANIDDVVLKYELFIKPVSGHEVILDLRES